MMFQVNGVRPLRQGFEETRPLNDPRASAIAIGAGLHAADAAAGAVAGGAI